MATQPELIEERRRVSPVVWVVIGLGVVLLLVFFVIVPLFGGNDETQTLPPPVANGPAVTTTATPAPPPSPASPVETFEQFGSKDPFRPLVRAGAPPTGGTTGTTAGTGTTTAGAGAVGAAGGPAPTGGQLVQVLDVFQDGGANKAQIKVGSTVYTVAPGAVFATNFKLVSISGNCATMLHGDDKFTLCEGEEVIK